MSSAPPTADGGPARVTPAMAEKISIDFVLAYFTRTASEDPSSVLKLYSPRAAVTVAGSPAGGTQSSPDGVAALVAAMNLAGARVKLHSIDSQAAGERSVLLTAHGVVEQADEREFIATFVLTGKCPRPRGPGQGPWPPGRPAWATTSASAAASSGRALRTR